MSDSELKLYTLPTYEPEMEVVNVQQVRAVVSEQLRNLNEPIQMQQNHMESANFVSGTAGWRLNANGDLEANDGNFRGDITGASGTFSGTITASAGSIGGFNIGSDYVRDAANSFGLASTVTGGDDVRFWAGDTFANRATAPFRITEAGVVVGTSATFTGTINATGGYVGSTTALVYEATGINTGTTGHIRGGQTAYNTGTGFFLGYESAAYKFSIGNPATRYITWDGTDLTVNGYTQTNIGSFGGDGSDGALSISSGTTTIDASGEKVVVKNYTSVSITGTAKLTISNPNSEGTILIIKSQGNVTISSTQPGIDMSAMGAAGGAGGGGGISGSPGDPGSNGTNGLFILDNDNHYGNAGAAANDITGGAGGAASSALTNKFFYTTPDPARLHKKAINLACGSGGGGGGGGESNGIPGEAGDGGNGGNGGGVIIVECAGALNFTGSISVAGGNGADGQDFQTGNNVGAGGGGGGGSAGMAIVLYNTLTSSSGTVVVTGGAGGAGGDTKIGDGSGRDAAGGGGGAGATSYTGVGAAGGAGGNSQQNGTAGTAASNTGSGGGGGGGAGAETTNGATNTGGAGGNGGSAVSTHYLVAQNKFFS